MKVDGTHYRSIWLNEDRRSVEIIDQTLLPHQFETRTLQSPADAAEAISNMRVRGAPLIGATAAYGVALAMSRRADDDMLQETASLLLSTRPTAVNLRWALERMRRIALETPDVEALTAEACAIHNEDRRLCRAIGEHGKHLVKPGTNLLTLQRRLVGRIRTRNCDRSHVPGSR